MLVWLNGNGASASDFTNKRSMPTVHSSIAGRLSSIGQLAEYLSSATQPDNYLWHEFRDATGDFWIREDVCDFVAIDDRPSVVLDIAFHSQNDADSDLSLNDCGPASSCMMLERAGISATVKEFIRMAGINHDGFTGFDDNMRGIRAYNHQPVFKRPYHLADIIREVRTGNPVFSLVYYHHINPGKNYGHFLVTVGYKMIANQLWMVVHDPNRQAYMEFAAEQFGRALAYEGSSQNMPYQSYIISDYPEIELPDPQPILELTPYQRLILKKLDTIVALLQGD